jgi:seryl-tRNA synthetase
MIEHPIQTMQSPTTTLSNELVERASRLMKEGKQLQQEEQVSQKSSNIDVKQIQQIVESTVRKVLKENGLISESEEKANEVFTFKVGKHIFEGKVTKIKKIA